MTIHFTRTTPHTDQAKAFLAGGPKQLLIDGDWTDAWSGETFETRDPATLRTLAHLSKGSATDADKAVVSARASFEDQRWRSMTPSARGKVIWKIGELIDQHAEALAELETLDQGKVWGTSRFAEIPASAEQFRYFAGFATKISGQTITPSITYQPAGKQIAAHTLREPVGVVAAITPWNSPLLMAAMKLAPALAAGCSVVLKPAEDTSLTALYLGNLLLEAGIPPGVANIVTGFGHDLGVCLAEHPDVDKLAFTGSTATGRKLIEAAAGNLKKLTLELGGKSPFIVLDDADIDAALDGAMRGVFANGGQVCVSGSRIYVGRPIFDRFVDRLAEQTADMQLGHGLDQGTQMGPLINPAHAAKVADYVSGSAKDGASVITGGGLDGPHNSFVRPAVIVNPKADSALMRKEVFGPVAAVCAFDEIDDVLRQANDTRYGLAASVWTQNLSHAYRLSASIKAGTVWINGHSYFSPELPKGGWKESGWGVENNAEGLDNYLQTKTVCTIY
ncbi:MAG: aldehyde dehydrogenase family protein [Pseudomonadota bacterium]